MSTCIAALGAVLLVAGSLSLATAGPAQADATTCDQLFYTKIDLSSGKTSVTVEGMTVGALSWEGKTLSWVMQPGWAVNLCIKSGEKTGDVGTPKITQIAGAVGTDSRTIDQNISHIGWKDPSGPDGPTAVPADVVQSAKCEVQGYFEVPETEGVEYLLGDQVVSGKVMGPVTGTLQARALPEYVLENPEWSQSINIPAAADCPDGPTPQNPTVVQSAQCEVPGTYTIPATPGVRYLLDGQPIEAGTYTGAKTGKLTAEAVEDIALTDPEWSFMLDVKPAADCPEVLPTEAVDVCTNIAGAQSAVPAGYAEKDGVCTTIAGTDTEEPEVLGVQQEVPTAVNAGLGEMASDTSSSGLLGQGVLGGGIVMLLLAAWLRYGRVERGAHQV